MPPNGRVKDVHSGSVPKNRAIRKTASLKVGIKDAQEDKMIIKSSSLGRRSAPPTGDRSRKDCSRSHGSSSVGQSTVTSCGESISSTGHEFEASHDAYLDIAPQAPADFSGPDAAFENPFAAPSESVHAMLQQVISAVEAVDVGDACLIGEHAHGGYDWWQYIPPDESYINDLLPSLEQLDLSRQ
eukprot:jgi/Ulvmu1/717/UM010_0089.1